MSIKNTIGSILKKILPMRYYKLVANGFILVPSYYKTIISDAERNFDLSQEDSDERCLLLMRKYGHILDKGLHREDVAPGHSKNYYILLKESVDRLSSSQFKDDPTLQWAKGKIKAYELLQSDENFRHLKGRIIQSPITFETFSELVKERRSNRDFTEQAVSQGDINRLKSLANWASSSCNKQPIEIYCTNDPILASECLKCCKGGTGFSSHIPSFWVFSCSVVGYVWPSEMFLPMVDTCLGIQNVMLGATTLGMSGTLLSWAQKSEEEETKLRELLRILPHHQIILCGVIGYAKNNFIPPTRKS